MLTLHLSLRYTFRRWINLLAILAVAFTLVVQIVVMAVLDGMLHDYKKRIHEITEAISISHSSGIFTESEYAALESAVLSVNGVTHTAPLVMTSGVVESRGIQGVRIVGIDLAAQLRASNLSDYLIASHIKQDHPVWSDSGVGILLGRSVAESIGAEVGYTVQISCMTSASGEIRRAKLPVVGLINSGNYIVDAHTVYVPIGVLRTLIYKDFEQFPETLSSVMQVWIEDPMLAGEKAAEIRTAAYLSSPALSITASTWIEQNRIVMEAMVHENGLQQIVLALIIMSSSFCVFAILITLSWARKRDIGLIRCLGGSRTDVCLLFLFVGLWIGILSAVFGTLGGIYLAPHVGTIWEAISGEPLYPPHLFEVTAKLPILIIWWKVFASAAGAIVVCLLSAVYPAFMASFMNPVDAVRDE